MLKNTRNLPIDGSFEQLRLRYDEKHRALWYFLKPHKRPCFNPELLAELKTFQSELVRVNTTALEQGEPVPVRYTVLGSDIPRVFNLGGDLALFYKLIVGRDRKKLQHYATACIDVLYPNAVAFDLPMTTISLVQGDALAGGCEAAISSNIVIAEKSARFGLPEVLFNLIPGMGAYSFLIRKVSPNVAERLILGGDMISAAQMHRMGLVDYLVDDGKGEAAVDDFLARHYRRANAQAALNRVKQMLNPVTYEELIAVTRIWVDAALQLSERDLKVLSRIVQAQNRSFVRPKEKKNVGLPNKALEASG